MNTKEKVGALQSGWLVVVLYIRLDFCYLVEIWGCGDSQALPVFVGVWVCLVSSHFCALQNILVCCETE